MLVLPSQFSFRCLKVWGVSVASERRTRKLAKERVTTAVVAEAVPFAFSLKRVWEEVRAAPLVPFPFVTVKVWEQLDQKKRYNAPRTYVYLDPFLRFCNSL